MLCFWFIAGPPFDAALWSDTAKRLQSLGLKTRCHPILRNGSGDLASEAAALSAAISASEDQVILVGHGTALPLVIEVARTTELRGVGLTNGPLAEADPFTRTLCRLACLPKPMNKAVFHPRVSMRLLSSSVGLRRAVVNPYVMGHDTVVTICGPILEDSAIRQRAQQYLKSIAKHPPLQPNIEAPTLVCWGDSDPITYRNIETFKASSPVNIDFERVPGGRYLHPVERPWEVAEVLLNWTEKLPTTT